MEEDDEFGVLTEEDETMPASTICNANRGVKDTRSFSIITGFCPFSFSRGDDKFVFVKRNYEDRENFGK